LLPKPNNNFLFESLQGRFHHVLYIPPPTEEEAIELIKYFTNKCQLNCDWSVVASRYWIGSSGAEIENICREQKLKEISLLIQNIESSSVSSE